MQCCNLSNQTAIITGASRGIGKAIAIKLASCGANIILVSRNKNDLKIIEKNIHNFGGKAHSITGDISNMDSFLDIIDQTLEKFKTIDILVNNAGITKDNIIMRMKEDEWDNVINTNLKGCFNGIKAASRYMIKNKSGKIVNITSVIGQIGNAGQGNYAAAKAGIIGLTKSSAKELGSRNITVNAIAPGYISTSMTNELKHDIKEQLKSTIPLKRLGAPEDVASLVCFLVSKEANYITGQTFNVDGGMVMI